MAGKRNADPATPTRATTSPKKARTPPEKLERDMNLATGATYEIRVARLSTGENIYKIINENDTNDAFDRKLEDGIKENTLKLSSHLKLRGSVARRQSLYDDETLKNTKNRYNRHYFLQYCASDGDSTLFQMNTALTIKKVSRADRT